VTPTPNTRRWYSQLFVIAMSGVLAAPRFNEADGLSQFHQRLGTVVHSVGESWEVIYVNDGSSDRDQDRNTMKDSGPGADYGALGMTEAAYFRAINDRGGIPGAGSAPRLFRGSSCSPRRSRW
jgi:hypothetical protein